MTTTAASLPMVARADHLPGPLQGGRTSDDDAALPEDGHRDDVIDGVLSLLPGPTRDHQTALSWFVFYLMLHVHQPGLGRVFAAPFDLLLPDARPAQPDVMVVLTQYQGIITDRGIEGPADLVIDIGSAGTRTHDRGVKLTASAGGGVPEYWLAEPADQTIAVLTLVDGGYRSRSVFRGAALLPTRALPELPMRVEPLFA